MRWVVRGPQMEFPVRVQALPLFEVGRQMRWHGRPAPERMEDLGDLRCHGNDPTSWESERPCASHERRAFQRGGVRVEDRGLPGRPEHTGSRCVVVKRQFGAGRGKAPAVAAAGAVSLPLRLGLSRVLDQNIAQPPRGYSDCEYFAGQSKGAYSASPLYVGTEVIQTAGGPDERNSDLRSELPRSDA